MLASARLRGLRDAYTARVELWRKDAHGMDACPATGCGSGVTLDPMHVLFECTAPAVLAARDRLVNDLPYIATRLLEICYEVTDTAGDFSLETATARVARVAAFRELVRSTNWSFPDCRWTAFRILLCVPWPADAVSQTSPDVSCALAREMGAAFDGVCVRHHRLRHLANVWAGWASRSVERVVGAWKAAVPAPLTNSRAGSVGGPREEDDATTIADTRSHAAPLTLSVPDEVRSGMRLAQRCEYSSSSPRGVRKSERFMEYGGLTQAVPQI